MSQTYYIGLLSGTSADCIDGLIVDWQTNRPRIVSTYTLDIPEKIKRMVFDLAISGKDEIEQIRYLDYQFAQLFSDTAIALYQQANISPQHVSAIGSHGQTIRHHPPEKDIPGYTLQIGDPNIIAEKTGITTVADFRRRDIAAGGQGAPLAPALHDALFRSTSTDRIILNTGGIANITYLPSDGDTIGFDTGPANGLMDSWCQLHKGQSYDANGEWAASGITQPQLLEQFLQHPFFSLPSPKSTGRESFNLSWLQEQLKQFNQDITPEDVQATLLSLTVESIALHINQITTSSEVYICGGGAHNTELCKRLEQRLSPNSFATSDALDIPPDWVEAVAFSWMAKQTMERLTGNLPKVTGAKRKVILGGVYWG